MIMVDETLIQTIKVNLKVGLHPRIDINRYIADEAAHVIIEILERE